jgi:hypothetical protein
MSSEAWRGIAPHINRLLEAGILRPCHSAWNTPLLPVKKPGGKDYRPVQDLKEVNKRVEDIHPTVPNPYTLLSHLSPSHVWYITLDLKDAFFSIALAPNSQHIFLPSNGIMKIREPPDSEHGLDFHKVSKTPLLCSMRLLIRIWTDIARATVPSHFCSM